MDYIIYGIIALGFIYIINTAMLLRKRSNESYKAKQELLEIHDNIFYLINKCIDEYKKKALDDGGTVGMIKASHNFFDHVKEIVKIEQIDTIEKFKYLLNEKDKLKLDSLENKKAYNHLLLTITKYDKKIVELNIKK